MTIRALFSQSATVRSGLGIFALGLVAVAVLSACGGGDPVPVPTSTTTVVPKTYLTSSSPTTPTLTVTAGTLRYMIQGTVELASVSTPVSITGTTAIPLTYGTGNASTAVIGIDTHSLAAAGSTPTYAVQYFMGDTTFALGRWTKGLPTINNVAASTPLTGTDSTAVHYLITRDLAGAPADGTYPCNPLGVWTSGLTYSGNDPGTTAPSDTTALSFLQPNATITVTGGVPTLSVTSFLLYFPSALGGDSVAHTVTFATPGPKEDTATSRYLSHGEEGIAYVLGQGPDVNSISLGIAFRRAVDSGPYKGARYKGMTRVVCTKT